MAGVADFEHESSRNLPQTTPSAYALELSKAWYERQQGQPSPFILKELGAHMLFSHILQSVGLSMLQFHHDRNRVLVRNRVANLIPRERPDAYPYTVTLIETSYMEPSQREWRGVTPQLGFRDERGRPFFLHEQQSLMIMDWIVRGPFLPPSEDYDLLNKMASDFVGVIEPTGAVGIDVSFLLERQKMYAETLEGVADALAIGRPETGVQTAIDFIVPRPGYPDEGRRH